MFHSTQIKHRMGVDPTSVEFAHVRDLPSLTAFSLQQWRSLGGIQISKGWYLKSLSRSLPDLVDQHD